MEARRVGRSWSQGLLWHQPADVDEAASAAARADARFGGSALMTVFWVSRRSRLGRRRGGALEFQEQAGARGEVAPGRVPEAKIADLVQAAGEDVLEETAHELVAREATGARAG